MNYVSTKLLNKFEINLYICIHIYKLHKLVLETFSNKGENPKVMRKLQIKCDFIELKQTLTKYAMCS